MKLNSNNYLHNSSGSFSDTSQHLSHTQVELDAGQNAFLRESTNVTSLASMMMGGLAYRLGKIAALQSLGSLASTSRIIPRILAPLAGLSSEVTAFQGTERILSSFTEEGRRNQNLFHWSGEGGFSEGWKNSLVDFGVMKSVGHLLHGSNIITQHLSQDLSMVAGHQATAFLGWTPPPEGSFAAQLMHAEITNIQLGIGTHLSGMITGHQVHQLERNFEQHLEMHAASHEGIFNEHALESLLPQERIQSMRSEDEERIYQDEITRRLGDFPVDDLTGLNQRTHAQWRLWESANPQEASRLPELENFLVIYAQVAVAHYGRDVPRYLEFNERIFQLAKLCFESGGLGSLGSGDRNLMIRFLSQQPGRVHGENGSARKLYTQTRASVLRRNEMDAILRGKTSEWNEHRDSRILALGLEEKERTSLSQRSQNLFEAYISYLHGQFKGNLPNNIKQIPFQSLLFDQCLADSSSIPYPETSIQIVRDFLQGPRAEGAVVIPPETNGTGMNVGKIPQAHEAFIRPLPKETWPQFLERIGITRSEIDKAELGFAGNTAFHWGHELDEDGRKKPPGDILNLLSIISYINSRKRGLIDPFDAIKLTHIEQLEHMIADEQGNIIIRYSKLLDNIPPEQFNLATLLRNYLNTLDAAKDKDLADQWGVSETTVRDYRNGDTRRMNIRSLHKLHEGLCPKSATLEERNDLWNLLMFLRYRPFFDATIPIISGSTGEYFNKVAAIPSDHRVVLVSTESSLREIDLSRRIPFEKDPFAAVMDGTVDGVDGCFALLNKKMAEFALLRDARIVLPEQKLSPEEVKGRINTFSARHEQYKAQLIKYRDNAVDLAHNLIRPNQVREIENFYHDLFRFTELVCIQATTQGRISYENTGIDYEITAPSEDFPKGVRFEQNRDNPNLWKAYVVVEDIIEESQRNPQDFNEAMVSDLVELRVLHAYQTQLGWFNGNPEHNNEIFAASLRSAGYKQRHEDSLTWYYMLEDAAEIWRPSLVEKGNDPTLHRIRGGNRSKGTVREKRNEAWAQDLQCFAIENGYAGVTPLLQSAFQKYQELNSSFLTRFVEDHLSTAVLHAGENELPETVTQIENALKNFLERMGIPHAKPETDTIPPISEEGFANVLFATYLQRYHALNPVRGNVGLVADEALMTEVFADRVGEAGQFSSRKDEIFRTLKNLIEDYNKRPGLLFIRPLPEANLFDEPFPENLYTRIFLRCIQRLEEERPGSGNQIHRQFIHASMGLMRDHLRMGTGPDTDRISNAFNVVHDRLAQGGIHLDPALREIHLEVLRNFCAEIRQELASVQRIAQLIPAFVINRAYESGLVKSQGLGNDVQKLFIEYATSCILESRAPKLKTVISRQVNERYARYDKIREDVTKDLQTLLLHALRHYREQYDTIEHNLESALASAREHASGNQSKQPRRGVEGEAPTALPMEGATQAPLIEQFWSEFVDVAQRDNPTISTKDELLERTEDLQRFLPHILPNRTFDLIEKIESAEQEIAALESNKAATAPAKVEETPFDVASILETNPSAELLEAHPELAHMNNEAIEAQILENPRLASPAARDLLQLLAFLRMHGKELHADAKDAYEELVTEIETHPRTGLLPEASLSTLNARARDLYRDIRSKAKPLSLLRFYPELQREGRSAPATDQEAGEVLIRMISEMNLGEAKIHEIYQMMLPSAEPSALHANLARTYTDSKNPLRSLVLGAEKIKPAQNGNAFELLPEHRALIENEAPEMLLASLENWRDIAEEIIRNLSTRFPGKENNLQALFSNSYFHLVLSIGRLANRELSYSHDKATKAMREAFAPLGKIQSMAYMLVIAGAAPEQVARWSHRESLIIYKSIQAKMVKEIGSTRIVGVLPELQAEAIPEDITYPDHPEISLRKIAPEFHSLARLNQRLSRLNNPDLIKKYEEILAQAEPLDATLTPEQVNQNLRNTQRKLAQFYFENRAEIRADEQSNADARLASALAEIETQNQARHELNLYVPQEITGLLKDFSNRIREYFRLAKEENRNDFGIAEASLAPGECYIAPLTRDDYRNIHRRLDDGKTFNVSAVTGSSAPEGQQGIINITSRAVGVREQGLIRPYLHLELPLSVLRLLEVAETVPGLGKDYRIILERGAHYFAAGLPLANIHLLLARQMNAAYARHQSKVRDSMRLEKLINKKEIRDVLSQDLSHALITDPSSQYQLIYGAVAKLIAIHVPQAKEELIAVAGGKNQSRDCALLYLKYRPEILRLLTERKSGTINVEASTRQSVFESYPEFELAPLGEDWQSLAAGNADKAFLMHLSNYLQKHTEVLHGNTKTRAQQLERDIGIAFLNPEDRNLTQEIRRIYDQELRSILLDKLPPLSRASLYPEFRHTDGSRASIEEVGRRLVLFLDEREIPERVRTALQRAILPFIRNLTRAKIPALHEAYARVYVQHRDKHQLQNSPVLAKRFPPYETGPQFRKIQQQQMPELPILDGATWRSVAADLIRRAGDHPAAASLRYNVDQPDSHFDLSLYYLSERLAERYPEWRDSPLRALLDPIATLDETAIFLEAGFPPIIGTSRIKARSISRLNEIREAMLPFLLAYYGNKKFVECIPEFTLLERANGWPGSLLEVECFGSLTDRAFGMMLVREHPVIAMAFFLGTHLSLPPSTMKDFSKVRDKLFWRIRDQKQIGPEQEALFLWFYLTRRKVILPGLPASIKPSNTDIELPLISPLERSVDILEAAPADSGEVRAAVEQITALDALAEASRRSTPTLREQYFARYPELEAFEITQRGEAFTGDITEISARLITTLNGIKIRLPKPDRKIADRIIAMGDALSKLKDQSSLEARLKEYDKIRTHVLTLLNPLDRLRILPEFRNVDGSIEYDTRKVGKRLVEYINQHKIPDEVDREFNPYVQRLNPKRAEESVKALQEGFAKIYLRHRDKHNLPQLPSTQNDFTPFKTNNDIKKELAQSMPELPLLEPDAWRATVEEIGSRTNEHPATDYLLAILSSQYCRGAVSLYHLSNRLTERFPAWKNQPQRRAIDPVNYLDILNLYKEAGLSIGAGINFINGAMHGPALQATRRIIKPMIDALNDVKKAEEAVDLAIAAGINPDDLATLTPGNDYLDRYPELELATLTSFSGVDFPATNLEHPIFRLPILMMQYVSRTSPALSKKGLALSAKIMGEVKKQDSSIDDITEECLRGYDEIRDEFLKAIPVLDRLSLLPEFRNADRSRNTGRELGAKLTDYVLSRKLQGTLGDQVDKITYQFAESAKRNIDAFHRDLADLYLKNLNDFQSAQTHELCPAPTQYTGEDVNDRNFQGVFATVPLLENNEWRAEADSTLASVPHEHPARSALEIALAHPYARSWISLRRFVAQASSTSAFFRSNSIRQISELEPNLAGLGALQEAGAPPEYLAYILSRNCKVWLQKNSEAFFNALIQYYGMNGLVAQLPEFRAMKRINLREKLRGIANLTIAALSSRDPSARQTNFLEKLLDKYPIGAYISFLIYGHEMPAVTTGAFLNYQKIMERRYSNRDHSFLLIYLHFRSHILPVLPAELSREDNGVPEGGPSGTPPPDGGNPPPGNGTTPAHDATPTVAAFIPPAESNREALPQNLAEEVAAYPEIAATRVGSTILPGEVTRLRPSFPVVYQTSTKVLHRVLRLPTDHPRRKELEKILLQHRGLTINVEPPKHENALNTLCQAVLEFYQRHREELKDTETSPAAGSLEDIHARLDPLLDEFTELENPSPELERTRERLESTKHHSILLKQDGCYIKYHSKGKIEAAIGPSQIMATMAKARNSELLVIDEHTQIRRKDVIYQGYVSPNFALRATARFLYSVRARRALVQIKSRKDSDTFFNSMDTISDLWTLGAPLEWILERGYQRIREAYPHARPSTTRPAGETSTASPARIEPKQKLNPAETEAAVAALPEIQGEVLIAPVLEEETARLTPPPLAVFETCGKALRRILRLPDQHPVKRNVLGHLQKYRHIELAENPTGHFQNLKRLADLILSIYHQHREDLRNVAPAEAENISEIRERLHRNAGDLWELKVKDINVNPEEEQITLNALRVSAEFPHTHYFIAKGKFISLSEEDHINVMTELNKPGGTCSTFEVFGAPLTQKDITSHGALPPSGMFHRFLFQYLMPETTARIFSIRVHHNIREIAIIPSHGGDLLALGAPLGWTLDFIQNEVALPLYQRARTRKLFGNLNVEEYVSGLEEIRNAQPIDVDYPDNVRHLVPKALPKYRIFARCSEIILGLPESNPHRIWLDKLLNAPLRETKQDKFWKEIDERAAETIRYYAEHRSEWENIPREDLSLAELKRMDAALDVSDEIITAQLSRVDMKRAYAIDIINPNHKHILYDMASTPMGLSEAEYQKLQSLPSNGSMEVRGKIIYRNNIKMTRSGPDVDFDRLFYYIPALAHMPHTFAILEAIQFRAREKDNTRLQRELANRLVLEGALNQAGIPFPYMALMHFRMVKDEMQGYLEARRKD